jgi:hypothetical protein
MSGEEISRRALLGAVVAVPLVGEISAVTPPPPFGRSPSPSKLGEDWRRALARLRAVEAEVRAIERATAGGTAAAEEALEAVYMERLGQHSAALLRLMRVRAPDLAALALKIELAIDEEVGTLTGGEVCLAILKRDVRRLMK